VLIIIPLSSSSSLSTTSTQPPNTYLLWLKEDDSEEIEDEYARYCDLPTVPNIKEGYKWWIEKTQQKRFPNLAKMALDILSIPAMSADPERLFSGSKVTITDRRNRLTIETIQALQCLKSWLGLEVLIEDDPADDDAQYYGQTEPQGGRASQGAL
jgi:hypothetical protein